MSHRKLKACWWQRYYGKGSPQKMCYFGAGNLWTHASLARVQPRITVRGSMKWQTTLVRTTWQFSFSHGVLIHKTKIHLCSNSRVFSAVSIYRTKRFFEKFPTREKKKTKHKTLTWMCSSRGMGLTLGWKLNKPVALTPSHWDTSCTTHKSKTLMS